MGDADRCNRHGGRLGLSDANLAAEAGNRLARAGAYRARLECGQGRRTTRGRNPAAWRGHLDATLPKPGKLTRGHHAALAYTDMPAFMADLRARPALAALALELAILTATRTSEVLNAEWSEFDLDAGLWTIPAERMKARKEHRVALSKRALAIVKELSAREAQNSCSPVKSRASRFRTWPC